MTSLTARMYGRMGRVGLAAALIVAMSLPASAQLSRMLSNSQLKPEDIEMATEAATLLYSRPGVRVGDTSEWSNEKTGARGVVEVTKVDQGGACVSFRHTTVAGANKQSQSASRRCRTADNTWVLSPE